MCFDMVFDKITDAIAMQCAYIKKNYNVKSLITC